ncbi:MAG: monooxygenase [Caulobacteraceae bacterium]|jgi:hypothetical protein|nr:monooxygenase [Caulobacteraceae bacterium]
MGITQNALTPNFPHVLDEQIRHIVEIIQRAQSVQARSIEPTPEAEAEWVDTIRRNSGLNLQFRMDCTPGYYNAEGMPGRGGIFDELYGPGPVAFYDLVRAWRAHGELAGLRMD